MPQSLLLSNTGLTLQFAIAFAFANSFANDPHWNYKLLEGPWYGFWCAALIDIFAGIPECIVFPQYPLLVIPGIDDREDMENIPYLAEEGSVDDDGEQEERSPDPPQVSEAQAYEDSNITSELVYGEDGLTPAWRDNTGSDPTSPPPTRTPPPLSIAKLFRITDFAVLYLTGVVEDKPFVLSDDIASVSDLLALPLKITDMLIPLILENKRVLVDPHRQLSFAQNQVIVQARFLFYKNQAQQYVVALVAAGSVWKWAKITRGHAEPPSSPSSIIDSSYEESLPQNPSWSFALTFGTPESTSALKKVYTLVKKLLEMNESSVHQENPQTHEYSDHDGDDGQDIESEGYSTPTRSYLSTRPPVSPATTDSLNIRSLEPPQTPTPSARSVINKRSCPSSSSPNPPTTLSESPTESPPVRQPKKRVRRIVSSPSPFPSSSSPNSPTESPGPVRQPKRRVQRTVLSPSPSNFSGTEGAED